MLKRWWRFALVITLALYLTSCANPPSNLSGGYGFGYCDGSLGQFDAYVIPMSDGSFQLAVIPVNVEQNGDILTISLATNSYSYVPVVQQVVANDNQEIDAQLTQSELYNYTILAITPYDSSGTPFLQQNASATAICNLPMPTGMSSSGMGSYAQARTARMPRRLSSRR